MKTYEKLSKRAAENRLLDTKLGALLGVYGLTIAEWVVLGYIYDGRTSVTQISKEHDTALAYITNTVNSLEKKAWVRRGSNDGDLRAKHLTFVGSDRKFAQIEEAISAIL